MTHAFGRLATAALALAAALFGAVVVLAPPAAAHAELVGTAPADGERLEEPPPQLTLEFTERVTLIAGGIELLDERGEPVRTPAPHVMGREVMVPLPDGLPRGGYVLSWRVVSGDTHPVAGAFTFGVAAPPASAAAVGASAGGLQPAVSVAVAACRWLGFAGLALLIGGTVFLLLCWPAGRAVPRARRIVFAGWTMAAVAALVGVVVHGAYVAGAPLTSALEPRLLGATLTDRFGLMHLLRLVLLVAALVVLRRWLLGPERPPVGAYVTGAAVALGLPLTHAGVAHASAGPVPGLAMTSDTVHLVVMSLWVGGLVVLVAAALWHHDRAGVRPALPRFSRMALGSVAVLVATGTWQAWREVGSLAGFTGTSYGRLVLAKIVLVGGLLGLGGLAWLAVRRAADPVARLRRIVPFEVLGVVAVLGVTAVLVTTPPARSALATDAGQQAGPQQATLAVPDGGSAQLRLVPAAPGHNEVQLTVRDAAGQPRAIPEAVLRASLDSRGLGPFDVPLRSTGPGVFTGQAALPFPGEWRLDLTVRTSDVDAYVLSTTMRVGSSTQHGGHR
jgi:copper transport protein